MSKGWLLGMLVVGAALVGCGDDSDGSSDAGASGSSGAAGSGGATGGTGGATGGTGGNPDGDAGVDAGMMLVCDDTMVAEPTCGGVTCDVLSAQALDACQITCCTDDDECGVKNTSARAIQVGLGACSVPAIEDMDCPGVSFGGNSGYGCCLESGFCGIAFMGSPCIDTSGFGGMAPQACGADADAGTL
jgi:hypothetical protein